MELKENPNIIITKDDIKKFFEKEIFKKYNITLKDFSLSIPTKGVNKGKLLLVTK